MKELYDKLQAISGLRVIANEPMSAHTTYGIGGPADIFLEVDSVQALLESTSILRQMKVGWFLLGDGANLLVSDLGIRGVVLHLGEGFEKIESDGYLLTCGSAARISKVADYAAARGMSGLEGVGTVPGSVGGAVVMNAGTHRGYISEVIRQIQAVDPAGNLVELNNEKCGFSYRNSRFQKETDFIITRVTMELHPGSPQEIAEELDKVREHRRNTQPQGRSAGCFFKNPENGSAGRLIQSAGLKGMRIGGAFVALEHANFIINDGTASAGDVLTLAKQVKKKVLDDYGVELEFEVRIVGEWR